MDAKGQWAAGGHRQAHTSHGASPSTHKHDKATRRNRGKRTSGLPSTSLANNAPTCNEAAHAARSSHSRPPHASINSGDTDVHLGRCHWRVRRRCRPERRAASGPAARRLAHKTQPPRSDETPPLAREDTRSRTTHSEGTWTRHRWASSGCGRGCEGGNDDCWSHQLEQGGGRVPAHNSVMNSSGFGGLQSDRKVKRSSRTPLPAASFAADMGPLVF